ncbi:hypothetical protein [Streptodolium elevatio]|uniref:Uncharacterized protein n=1 Tax=Streptodolium elevatio TaxID=3157996 RepID=A0ABV3DXV9_9ACTN
MWTSRPATAARSIACTPLVNGMGEFCPVCAPNAPEDDEDEERTEFDFGFDGVRVRPAS